MIKRREQTRITISKSEILVLHTSRNFAQADCQQCHEQVEMLTPEQAATVTGMRSLSLYHLAQTKQIHFIETREGHLLICLNSLKALDATDLAPKLALPP